VTLRPLPDLTIRQLEYLVAVADQPTWAIAAARVGVSASALSQGLAELERRVGVDLFEPAGRRRIVRPAAAPLLDHARQVLALTADVLDWADRLRTAQAGTVRLGMIDVAAVVHHPAVIRRFREERPDVELILTVAPSAPLLERLRSGELDLVVCVEPPAPIPGVSLVDLLEEPLWVLAPPGVTIGAPSTWGPWVLFPESSHTRQRVGEALRQLGAPVRVAAESHQPDVLLQMVRLGLGWTVLPAYADHSAQVEQQAAGVTIGRQLIRRRLVLARRIGAVADPAADDLASRLGYSGTGTT
jgi:DNA-binding transcriptional LysR family regulator